MSCGFWGVCPSRWHGSRETRSLVLTPGQGTESLSDLCVSVKGGGGASPLSFFISATPDSCPVVVMNDSRDTKKRQAGSCVALSVFTHSYSSEGDSLCDFLSVCGIGCLGGSPGLKYHSATLAGQRGSATGHGMWWFPSACLAPPLPCSRMPVCFG